MLPHGAGQDLLKGILKEKIRTWVIEKGIIIIFVGLIISAMYFWLGPNR